MLPALHSLPAGRRALAPTPRYRGLGWLMRDDHGCVGGLTALSAAVVRRAPRGRAQLLAAMSPAASPPRTVSACLELATGLSVALALSAACSIHANTRYFVQPSMSGHTISLHRGDNVTFVLSPASRNWVYGSSDQGVARPSGVEKTTFGDGSTASLANLSLVASGQALLVACPGPATTCEKSTPGAIWIQLVVDG